MTTPDDSAYRLSHRATAGVTVRESEEVEGDDDVFEVRMPIASTGEVRNEGDEPLTRGELDGMARQIRDREIGVFTSHGSDNLVTSGRYSQLEKLGVWTDARVDERDGEDLLMATARMPDPREMPAATGTYRQALAIVKEQATAGVPMDASIGWRDDDNSPGGVDLMEASIVGIGADPRTNTGDEGAAVVARAAVDAGADPAALVDEVRAAVESKRPLGPPDDPDRFDTYEECVQSLMDDDTSREEAEAICASWEQAKDEQADTEHDSMTDDDTGDDPGTTDEQSADDDGETTRAPDDLTEERLATFVAMHYDGYDESDVMEAADAADAEFIGTADVEALIDLASVVTGAEYGDVEAAMSDLMDGDNESEMDEDEDEEEDDEEQSADPDDEQDVDTDEDEERDTEDVDAVRSELAELREELDELRSGGLSGEDVETPESESERDATPDDDDAPESDTDENRAATDDDPAPSATDGLGGYR